MPQYNPPIENIKFILHDVLNAGQLADLPGNEDFSADLMDQILEEGGKICAEVLFPLNQSGDQEGCAYNDGEVTTQKDLKKPMICSPKAAGAAYPPTPNMAEWACLCWSIR